jgi:protein phosphatase 1 regulatory subunit 3A/B/C/D/E
LPTFNRNPLKSASNSKPPLRKAKSVRFADTQGLPLVEAVHQLTCKDSSYTANKIVPYDEQEDILGSLPLIATAPATTANKKGSSTLTPPRTLPQRSSSPPSSAKKVNSPSKLPVHKHTFTFGQPSLEPDFFERVERDSVVLESIREEPRSLHGIVRVFNLAYNKEVVIRWTHDGWRTSHDTNAVFCSNDGNTDRFAFELPINGDDVSFCIRYRVESGEYWDNNRGTNYTITSR